MLKYIQRLLKANLLLITITVALGIAFLSLINIGHVVVPKVSNSDKIGHCLAYTVLSFFTLITFYKSKRIFILLLCITYGILIEFFQSLLGYRTAELADVVANSVGVCIGFGFSKLYSQEK